MTINILIEQLSKTLKEKGDLECFTPNGEDDWELGPCLEPVRVSESETVDGRLIIVIHGRTEP